MSTVYKFGDNVDTDIIIPARYLNNADEKHLAAHCMEDAGTNFAKSVKKGDVLIAGENFGCGSSREHAPVAIKACGVQAVVAKSFARIFYRNAINIGLPIFECADAVNKTDAGDEITLNMRTGEIVNNTNGLKFNAAPFPPFIQSIIDKGGLLNCIEELK